MSEAPDDEAAIERVLAGDTAAFAAVVERWQGPLVNLAYRFCRDRGRAEDMAQEAFLQAFRRLGSWRRDAAFSTWLFALATNVYRTELRRTPPQTVPIDETAMTARSLDLPEGTVKARLSRGRALLKSKLENRL